MTQAEIEAELQTLSSQVQKMVEQGQSRENEWRRLGLMAKVLSILSSVGGAGLMVSNVWLQIRATNPNLSDQLLMMGIVFIVLSMPLMFAGAGAAPTGAMMRADVRCWHIASFRCYAIIRRLSGA